MGCLANLHTRIGREHESTGLRVYWLRSSDNLFLNFGTIWLKTVERSYSYP